MVHWMHEIFQPNPKPQTRKLSLPFLVPEEMEKLTKQRHLLLNFGAICCFVWLSLLSRTVKAEEGFNYDPCSVRGPKYWGELKKDWAKCKTGNIQSPIALSKWINAEPDPGLGDLKRKHKPADAVLKNSGHDIRVEWTKNAGSIKIKKMNYNLINYHWHHPSEHTQDGKTFPLELHMVHINNATNDTAVIGVFFEYGLPDPFISMIERDIMNLNIEGGEKFLRRVDPTVARLDGRKYFRYIGSLTTPPCSEGVIWTVMEKVQTVSPYQVQLFKQALVEVKNARPLQMINGRNVFYFDPFTWGGATAE